MLNQGKKVVPSESVFRSASYDSVRRHALAEARELASPTWRAETPAYDVASFARSCGAQVELTTLRDSGELLPDFSGGYRIRVNRTESWERQRFTVCHEIGHILFEQHTFFPGANVRGGRLTELFMVEEKVCDRIATLLLMPDEPFLALARRCSVSLKSLDVLAEAFGVTRESAAIRVLEVRPWRAAWIKWRIRRDGDPEPTWWSPRTQAHATEASGVVACVPALRDSVLGAYRRGEVVGYNLTGDWRVESVCLSVSGQRTVLTMLHHRTNIAPWVA